MRIKIPHYILCTVWLASLLFSALSARAAVNFTVSPSTVSNTYDGTITLTVTGLSAGETVTVQKFFDLTGAATIPAGSWISQQFNVTDNQAGMVIGGVTNTVVPGDTNVTSGTITVPLDFNYGDFSQTIAGKYFYRLSSPSNHFSPITNAFTVTNFGYPQHFAGTVVSNGTSTPVPNAVVLLFPPNGKGSPLAGTVSDSSGNYTLPGPVGQYALLALRSGFAFNLASAQLITLAPGATVNTNTSVLNAPATISGTVVDAITSAGLPGIFVTAQSTNETLAIAYTDASGAFSISVPTNASPWKIGTDSGSLNLHAYVSPQNKPTGTTGQTGLTLHVTQGTALFYGTLQNNLGAPLPNIGLFSQDNNGQYEYDGVTDASGNYFLPAIGGLSGDQWQVQFDNAPTNYMFTLPNYDNNGGTTLSVGQVVQANLTGLPTDYTISGTLLDPSSHPLTDVGVYANATINNVNYFQSANTDSNGSYVLHVAPGMWTVNVNSGQGNGNLPQGDFVAAQNITISNANATANFQAQSAPYTISGQLKDNLGNPIPNIGIFANTTSGPSYNVNASTDGNGDYTLNVVNGNWSVGINTGGGGNALPSTYLAPGNQNILINNASAVVNFTAVQTTDTISGTLKDNNGNPISGVNIYASTTNNNIVYNQNVTTDVGGNYSFGAINGIWQVGVNTCNCGNGSLPASFLAPGSQNVTVQNNNPVVNFTALTAAYTISGHVTSNGNNNIAGVGVGATATINNTFYSQYVDTDANGNYTLSVANGNWSVYVNCNNNLDSLQAILVGSFNCPQNQNVIINNASATVNIDVPLCGGVVINPNPSGLGEANSALNLSILATSCNPNFHNWMLLNPSALPAGLQFNSNNGTISGTTAATGQFLLSIAVSDGNGASTTNTVTLVIRAHVQIATLSLTNATNGLPYSQLLTGNFGLQPYIWALAPGSGPLPNAISLDTNGILSATGNVASTGGVFSINVLVTDALGATATQALSLTVISNSAPPPLAITTLNLPSATQFVGYTNAVTAANGTQPYTWSWAGVAAPTPAGLSINASNGLISGTPTAVGTSSVNITVKDSAGASNTMQFNLVVNANPNPGSLQVSIQPLSLNASWQLDSNGIVESSGTIVQGLAEGTHTISFSPVTGYVTPTNRQVSITNGLLTVAIVTYVPLGDGKLTVTILPASAASAGGEWGLDNSGLYVKSGALLPNVSPGNHTLNFKPISGWVTPASQNVVIISSITNTASGTYVAAGSLQVTLAPAGAIAEGAQWQLDATGPYHNSGVIVTNIPVGAHTINFAGVNYWTAPGQQNVVIKAKATTKATGSYTFAAAGIYNGLFAPGLPLIPDNNLATFTGITPQNIGMISDLSIAANGSYTAKILAESASATIKGTLNSSGQSTNIVGRSAAAEGNLVVVFNVDWNQTPPTIAGTVSGSANGGFTSDLHAEVAATDVASSDFTALLAPATNTPPGYGYFTLTNHLGIFKIVGALADGSPFLESSPTSVSNSIPIYESIYGGQGFIFGWVSLVQGQPAGTLLWLKPTSKTGLYQAGFTNLIALQGSTWTNPPLHTPVIPLTNGTLTISGGGLTVPLIYNVTVTSSNTLAVLPGSATNSLSASISPTTGVLSVKFGNGEGKTTVTGVGAALQSSDYGGGFFLTKTNSGSILLLPPP